jgi:hypothetical protein
LAVVTKNHPGGWWGESWVAAPTPKHGKPWEAVKIIGKVIFGAYFSKIENDVLMFVVSDGSEVGQGCGWLIELGLIGVDCCCCCCCGRGSCWLLLMCVNASEYKDAHFSLFIHQLRAGRQTNLRHNMWSPTAERSEAIHWSTTT